MTECHLADPNSDDSETADLMFRVAYALCALVGAFTLANLLVLGVCVLLVERARRRTPLTTRSAGGPSVGSAGRERRARTWHNVPGWVARDREWAVAVVLLGTPVVADRTHRHVDFARRAIDWPGLLIDASDWPENDRLLVYTAYDLTASTADDTTESSPVGLVTLPQLADMDASVAQRVQAAVDIRRGRCDYLTAVSRAGGLG